LAVNGGRKATVRRGNVKAVRLRWGRRRVVSTSYVGELLSGGDLERPLLDGGRKSLLGRPWPKLVLYVELILGLSLRLLRLWLERRCLLQLLVGLLRERRSAGMCGGREFDVKRRDRQMLVENGGGVDVELRLEQTVGDGTPVVEQPKERLLAFLDDLAERFERLRRTRNDHLSASGLLLHLRTRRHNWRTEDGGDGFEGELVLGEKGHLGEKGDEVDEEGEVGSREEAEDDLSASDARLHRVVRIDACSDVQAPKSLVEDGFGKVAEVAFEAVGREVEVSTSRKSSEEKRGRTGR
jgi:hypothetical protein